MTCNSKVLSTFDEENLSETIRNGDSIRKEIQGKMLGQKCQIHQILLTIGMMQKTYLKFQKVVLEKEIIKNKTEKSSTSLSYGEKAQKDFHPYLFSSWINLYLKPREAKTNMDDVDAESVSAITFPSNFLGSSLLSVKAMHLKMYIVSMPVS